MQKLPLGPLSVGALHNLLRDRLGLDVLRPELLRINEATTGNPFFAIELGRELRRIGTRPRPGERLPVPSDLGQLLGVRLSRLPGDVPDVLLIAALCGRPTVEVVAAAHGHDSGRSSCSIKERARVSSKLPIRGSGSCIPCSPPCCTTPAARPAPCRASCAFPGVQRRRGASATPRPSNDAPDASVAAELDVAAEHAAARGATAAGAELCELAAELTPEDPALARARRLRAARFHRLAGDAERAGALLRSLMEEVPSGVERSDIVFELAMTVRYDARLLDEAVAEAGDDDARRRESSRSGPGFASGRPTSKLRCSTGGERWRRPSASAIRS